MPVLKGAQFGEIVFAGLIHERVFVDPAHARGVRADDGIHALGQHAAHGVEVFDDSRARPINIRAVLEDDIDERLAEHRFAADELHLRRGDEARGDRISDLVLDEVGRTAFPIGIDDDLHVAEVGNGIERRRCSAKIPPAMPKIVKMAMRNLLRALASMMRSMSVDSWDVSDMAYFAASIAVTTPVQEIIPSSSRGFISLPPGKAPPSPTS